VQAAATIAMVLTLCDGFEGTLLVVVAMQLVMPRRRAFIWIGIQTLLLAIAVGIHWTPRAALLLAPPYLGFQLLAFLTLDSIEQSSRLSERLRIARDLHDTLGHHLTALSLNLEAALQRTSGDAHEKVAVAQSLARSLLDDIRGIVSQAEEQTDIVAAIRALIVNVPRPHIHLQIGNDVHADDPDRARTIIRCAQEIVTNAARHSGAENLWLAIDCDEGRVRIRAHDDGRGSTAVEYGFGLRAMRSRVELAGGELHIDSEAGRGFAVTALVPL